ncbi:MAG TPA: heavy metal translocating P-type ATPase metal-binding domain-containing protein [Thermodesulfobacteriota bacterium]|nr:heavy metal translocating P-type ATPase metal-binding domain-containing protein [Thermodesulfobacteriota bacterium]
MTNTTATRENSPGEVLPVSRCLHCGEDLDSSNTIESNGKLFCCNGCRSVYELLGSLGLDDYYAIRESQDIIQTTPPADPASGEDYGYLDSESFAGLYVREEKPHTMNFYVEGIECAACLWLIEKIPSFVPEIESLSLNMSDNTAAVNFTAENKFSSFPDTLKKLGYKAHPLKIDEDASGLKRRENRKSLIRLSIAAVCAGNIMLLSAAIYSGARGVFEEQFLILNLILSLPVVTYCSLPFYKSVIGSVRTGRATVDIPIVLVITAGFGISAYNYLSGSPEVYFDSITMFVFLLLASRYFLRSVQDRLNDGELLAKSLFSSNRVLVRDEGAKQFFYQPVEYLEPGRRIKLARGDRFPADGILLSRRAEVNLSVLTGENIPRTVSKGDTVYAGSILDSDEAVLDVTGTGASTRIGKILEEVESNYKSKISLSTYSDRYATVFTFAVGIIAAVSFFVVSSYYGASEALDRTIAFILISCPCAFVFVMPLSFGLFLKASSENGLLIKDARIFDKLPRVRSIYFDKTGTLTRGVYRILSWDTETLTEADRAAVLAIERESEHPVARAIVSCLSGENLDIPEVSGFRHIYSKGVEGRVSGHLYSLTAEACDTRQNEINEIIATRIVIRKDGEPVSEILLGDSLKEDAKFVVTELKKRGYSLYILSGDRDANVKQVAGKLDIPLGNVFSEKTPEMKSAIVRDMSGSMMIGDGLNDAGALSSSDVGVAIQGSVGESMKVSDAYILENDLFSILDLLDHGRIIRQTLRRNTFFSVSYNVSAGALALAGFINPLAAAVLMPLSSVLLIVSSLYGRNRTRIREGAARI